MSNNNMMKLYIKDNVEESYRVHRFQINPTEILINNLIPKEYKTYELIVAIDSPDNKAEEKAKDIFKEYIKEWKHINPNLKIMDARIYINTFSNQRLIIDFIPIERTLDKNNEYKEEPVRTMVKALKRQGCYDRRLWANNQKAILEDICKECDFEIYHDASKLHDEMKELIK